MDDVDAYPNATTSPHPVERLAGSSDFLLGTRADVMTGRGTVPQDRPVVCSPFGLGVLDLAVGKAVYDDIAAAGQLHVVEDFFSELRRHG